MTSDKSIILISEDSAFKERFSAVVRAEAIGRPETA